MNLDLYADVAGCLKQTSMTPMFGNLVHYGKAAVDVVLRVCRIALRTLALVAACCCGWVLPTFAALGFVAAWIAPSYVERALSTYVKMFYLYKPQDIPVCILWGVFCFLTGPATVAVAAFASGVALKILCSPILPGCKAVECTSWISYFFS